MRQGMRIETFQRDFVDAITSLDRRYLAEDPRGWSFVHRLEHANPLYEQGRNILCAFSRDALLGYGIVHPIPRCAKGSADVPRALRVAIHADPTCSAWDGVQAGLYEALVQRAGVLVHDVDGGRSILQICLPEGRGRELAFYRDRGWRVTDAIQQMGRSLDLPIPVSRPPEGVQVEPWPLDAPNKIETYAAAEASAFPKTVRSAKRIGQHVRSWAGGTPLVAFDDEDEIVGSTMAYWWCADGVGFTEDIFVLPRWRRRGLARYLLCTALAYLRAHGRSSACLEVLDSNVAAKAFYESLGYRTASRAFQASMKVVPQVARLDEIAASPLRVSSRRKVEV